MLAHHSVFAAHSIFADCELEYPFVFDAQYCLDAMEAMPAGSTRRVQGCDTDFEISSRSYRSMQE